MAVSAVLSENPKAIKTTPHPGTVTDITQNLC